MKYLALVALTLACGLAFGHGMPGGLSDMNQSSPTFERILGMAEIHLSSASNSVYSSKVVKVISARKQVVAGMKYILTLEVTETNCFKREGKKTSECSARDGAETLVCEVAILEQVWVPMTKVLSTACHKKQ